MNTDLGELLRVMRRELWVKRRLFAAVYLATAIVFLVLAWTWPKVYSSSSTIIVDQQSILEPLMQGTAVTTNVRDKAGAAREIIFSRQAMDEILSEGGWLRKNTTELERERLAEAIENRTVVENVGDNLIRITFIDRDPVRAYETAQQLTDTFINHSLSMKQRESREAYEFINGQVRQYHAKLQQANEAIRRFREDHAESRPGTQQEIQTRLAMLVNRKEETELAIREVETERETVAQQLSGSASLESVAGRAGMLAERLAQLEEELATLRLSYHDTYPDIVVLKGQIETIRTSLANEMATGEGSFVIGPTGGDLVRTLRGRYSDTETQLATLRQRLNETLRLIALEEERLAKANAVEVQLSELQRDYEVTQEIFQSLLRQRENARISMNIDLENQGLTIQVQEPPAMPRSSQGMRFSHFMAAGLIAAMVVPVGLIYGLSLIDQKVRSGTVISDELGLPILASVYHMNRPKEYTLSNFKTSMIILVILVSWIAYGYVAWIRVNG